MKSEAIAADEPISSQLIGKCISISSSTKTMETADHEPSETRKVVIAKCLGLEDANNKAMPTISGNNAGLHHKMIATP